MEAAGPVAGGGPARGSKRGWSTAAIIPSKGRSNEVQRDRPSSNDATADRRRRRRVASGQEGRAKVAKRVPSFDSLSFR